MILAGDQTAIVHAVQHVSLHGTEMVDLIYAHTDAPQELRKARVGLESLAEPVQPGDAITVTYLLNTVTQITKNDS